MLFRSAGGRTGELCAQQRGARNRAADASLATQLPFSTEPERDAGCPHGICDPFEHTGEHLGRRITGCERGRDLSDGMQERTLFSAACWRRRIIVRGNARRIAGRSRGQSGLVEEGTRKLGRNVRRDKMTDKTDRSSQDILPGTHAKPGTQINGFDAYTSALICSSSSAFDRFSPGCSSTCTHRSVPARSIRKYARFA